MYESQPSNKHHHQGGAVCYYSGMVMANQPTPPPGASAEWVGGGWCPRVLFNLHDWPRKKLLLNLIYYILIHSICTCCCQNDGITPLCTLPPSQTSSSLYPMLLSPLFGWLLCLSSSVGGRLRPQHDLLSIIFHYPNCLPNGEATSHHAPPRQHPSYRKH